MDKSPLPTTFARVMGRRLLDLRKQVRNWSMKTLIAKVKDRTGTSLNLAAMYKFEGGNRDDISIDRWLTLALALDVPPLALLLPPNGATKIQIAPNVAATGSELYAWIIGAAGAPRPDGAHAYKGAIAVHRYRLFQHLPYAAAVAGTVAHADIDKANLHQLLGMVTATDPADQANADQADNEEN